jgi:hypothetical protein
MIPRSHAKLSQALLVVNAVLWLAWGLINGVQPEALSGTLSAQSDRLRSIEPGRARRGSRQYGSMQTAIGLFALLGAFSTQQRASAVVFQLIAHTAEVAACLAGLMIARRSALPLVRS